MVHGIVLALNREGGSAMSDGENVPDLVKLASNATLLVEAQQTAAKRLLNYDGEVYPRDGCAITLSVLLQEGGIPVKDTYQAIALGNLLKSGRKWQVISIGDQKTGDVGSTCGPVANHGEDHVYVVLSVLNPDEMVVADNQQTKPHFRFASGKGGKTPTRFFLRAPTAALDDAGALQAIFRSPRSTKKKKKKKARSVGRDLAASARRLSLDRAKERRRRHLARRARNGVLGHDEDRP
jgi:hypothetical protein